VSKSICPTTSAPEKGKKKEKKRAAAAQYWEEIETVVGAGTIQGDCLKRRRGGKRSSRSVLYTREKEGGKPGRFGIEENPHLDRIRKGGKERKKKIVHSIKTTRKGRGGGKEGGWKYRFASSKEERCLLHRGEKSRTRE